MRQLSLFDGVPPPEEPAPAPALPAPAAPAPPEVLPGQLGLFELRTLALARAKALVAQAELGAALGEALAICQHFPLDPDLRVFADRVSALEKRLREVEGDPLALATLGRGQEPREPWSGLGRTLLREAASLELARHGDRATVGGAPVGALFLEAGALDEAERSLGRALALERTAPLLFPLADTLFEQGKTVEARAVYLEALLWGASVRALHDCHDPAVKELATVCAMELEIEEDPVAFSSVAGLLTGILPRVDPSRPPFDRCFTAEPGPGSLGLARAVGHWMLAAMHSPRGSEGAIAARRRLKALSASTLRAFSERLMR